MIKILAVEDDEYLLETLVEQISAEDRFKATGTRSIASAKEIIIDLDPDLVLLDVILPDGDGRDMCRWIREQGYTMPILMLTAQDSEEDTIEGLESGANDYVSKPLRFGEMLARINTHLKQYQSREDARSVVGAFYFIQGRRTLIHRDSGKSLNLTEKEASIIKLLLRHRGQVVNKTELLEKVWGYNASIATHTLETHIYRLRHKISHVDDSPFILTKDSGYTLAQI
jgi:DNA-binding response OmpR family regulator